MLSEAFLFVLHTSNSTLKVEIHMFHIGKLNPHCLILLWSQLLKTHFDQLCLTVEDVVHLSWYHWSA